jgi:hypothetical protein
VFVENCILPRTYGKVLKSEKTLFLVKGGKEVWVLRELANRR